MGIEGQGHFFTIYFPGFVCFVLYKSKISGENLQDHWSYVVFFRSAVKAAMSSIFHSFPPPVGPGIVTVGEQNGELAHVESGQTTAKVNTV